MPGTLHEKLRKQLAGELASAGVMTKSVSSEDGSAMSMRSADELKKLIDMAAEADAEPKRIRFARTSGPGAY